MSKKFGNYYKGIGILSLLVFFLGLIACDPCRQLAEEICNCRETDEQRRLCISELSIAKQHIYFENAQDPKICETALKNCSCKKINDNQDAECGMYRLISE